jgi:purine-cytosine permease-like protein
MDNFDKFLESLSLDPIGLDKQFLSFASFINILAAAATGFLVLVVYLVSSGRERRDRNLYMVIPVLCVLMAVMMRVTGPQVISFFGVFGILSIIRFRSDITDQRGITFILFAVIEGVIVGVNDYLLAILSWIVVGGAILIGRYFFNRRSSYRLVVTFPRMASADERDGVIAWFERRDVQASCTGFRTENGKKKNGWKERTKAEYALFPKTERGLIDLMAAYASEMREDGTETEFKRRENA